MWFSRLCAVRVGCSRALGASPIDCSSFLNRRLAQRVNVMVAYGHNKDSAIKHIIGISEDTTSNDLIQHPPGVSYNKAEHDSLLIQRPDQPENSKTLRVAILGAPNAGKSTLSNQLLGRKIFPVSKKVHTTRCQAQCVITDGETQLILLDTPGMVNPSKVKRHHLEKSLLQDPWDSLKSADLVLVLVDVSEHWSRNSLSTEIIKCLSQYQYIPSILVLNKVDLVKKKALLLDSTNTLTEGIVNKKTAVIQSMAKSPKAQVRVMSSSQMETCESSNSIQDCELATNLHHITEENVHPVVKKVGTVKDLKSRKGWPHFQDVFMLSAVNGDEVQTLKKYLLNLAKPGEWEYHSDIVTSQSPQEICNNIIREKLLEHLPQEIPYNVMQVTDAWEEGPAGELVIRQTLLVQKENHVKLLIGPGGQVVKQIALEAGQDLMNIFLCDVRLHLSVKIKK
ncbi:hypothetical protein GDO86_005583 [Hymenochirus boettgeri]|uniref:GTPase Era, mitochondrial n=1 Tax=Hymenochirus boettgeri TaxID=247094 RepID=A0A8T2J2G5_9PIPI|nr:hypothetical protein GDO86_005583 [Hymenochirus boettgeri]